MARPAIYQTIDGKLHKRCPMCKLTKPLEYPHYHHYSNSSTGHKSRCAECRRLLYREPSREYWRSKHPKKEKAHDATDHP